MFHHAVKHTAFERRFVWGKCQWSLQSKLKTQQKHDVFLD
jgi:hypothetical protein